MATITKQKEFKVVSVSNNINSFGLYGVILMGRDGESYQVGASHIHLPKQGDILKNNVHYNAKTQQRLLKELSWSLSGFEIPERLPDAPFNVVQQVWGRSSLIMIDKDKFDSKFKYEKINED